MKLGTQSRRAGCAVLGVALLSLVSCGHGDNGTGGNAPAGLAFYQPPAVLPGKAGDVIWQRPITINGISAKSWKVLYHSVNATGKDIGVSGVIVVPTAPYASGPRPIVTIAPETAGITDDCAPSKSISNNDWIELDYVKQAVNRGYAVAVTDYEGLGTPGRHTYMVKDAQAHAMLDVTRAAIRFPDMGLTAASPVGFWGYSQGGGGAAAAAEGAASYAPELQVKGTSAGGVPADLMAVGSSLEGGFYGFALAAAQGFDAAYPELNLKGLLNQAGRDLIDGIDSERRSTCLVSLTSDFIGKRPSDYTTTPPQQIPAWQARLSQSLLGKTKPSAPIYVYHAIADEIIPNGVGSALKDRYCGLGATVSWNGIVPGEHLMGETVGAGDALNFLTDRFEGKPAPKSC